MVLLLKSAFCLFQVVGCSLLFSSGAFQISPTPMRTARFIQSRIFPRLITSKSNAEINRRVRHVGGISSPIFGTPQKEIPSNRELVQKRLEVAKAKKEARQKSIEDTIKRQLHIKSVVESKENEGADFAVPALYAVKVSVCDDLRNEYRLSGREKRGRVFIEIGSPATRSLKALKYDIHAFFKALRKSSFVLSASLPEVSPDGSLLAPDNMNSSNTWDIEADEDVAKTFEMANDFFKTASISGLKRPSVIIHLKKDPNAPPPPPPPAYLENMADPSKSPTMTMLSFYSFPPSGIEDPEDFAMYLRRKWKPFEALGRVYVAEEGVNAQMSVPTNVLDNFIECCQSLPHLGSFMENGINIDPKPLSTEEFATAGVVTNGKPSPPFKSLHVRVRNQIVADGLNKPLDWQSAGYDMPPLEWHRKLKEAKEKREAGNVTAGDDIPLILDCRNDYETDIGRFDGAQPLNTTNFRDSWDVLKERMKNVSKDSEILIYCTGGIRCVKVGAALTQELGFKNVSRLAGGIIAYDRTIEEQAKDEKPLFLGSNMVFDGRLGRQITDDKLGSCITCGGETSLISNCLNDNCHKRMIQCESCKTSFHGTCSDACKLRLAKNNVMRPRKVEISPSDSFQTLDEYSFRHSSPPPSLLNEIELNTRAYLPSGSHMVSGFEQGRLLTHLASMTREGRILELGTFTGYSTVCLLEGAANVASVTGVTGSRDSGPYVLSMERDHRAFNLASAHLKVMADYGSDEAGAEAACALRSAGGPDFVEDVGGDLVSVMYNNAATCDLLKVSDALASMEEMALGQSSSLKQPAPFDMVFIDADKTRLVDYMEACLDGDRILKKGGLIVVDNVLWKGLVLGAAGSVPLLVDEEGAEEAELKKNRRARKLASKMHRFNSAIVKDPRCEVLLLQVRDGLSMIRKK